MSTLNSFTLDYGRRCGVIKLTATRTFHKSLQVWGRSAKKAQYVHAVIFVAMYMYKQIYLPKNMVYPKTSSDSMIQNRIHHKHDKNTEAITVHVFPITTKQ